MLGAPGDADEFIPISVFAPAEHQGVVFQLTEVGAEAAPPAPLVVLLGGSNGGLWYGAMGWELNQAGFSTMSLAYFGHEGQSSHLIERPLEPIVATITLARQSRGTNRRCVAIIGVSKGGELALLLAAYEQEFDLATLPLSDAYVAASPSHVVWQSPHITLRSRSSWSLNGAAMDFVPHPWLSPHLPDVFFNRWRVGRYLSDALDNAQAVDRATIPVERITQPTLLLAGEQDEMWPAAEMSRSALRRAQELNPASPLQVSLRPLDHFVLSDAEARREVIAFIRSSLSSRIQAGACEADLPDVPSVQN